MPLKVSTADRKLLLIAGGVILLIVAGLALLSPAESDNWGFPSSYNTRRRGAKAAYLLLAQLGYRIERWHKPPQELPKENAGTALIVAEPRLHPDNDEENALRNFVLSGGTLIVAGAYSRFAPNAHVASGAYRPADTECVAATPTRLTRGGPLVVDGILAWDKNDVAPIVHYVCKDDAVVVSYRSGKGEVIWWATATPLTNAGLRDKGTLDLLINSVGDARIVLWDEYFHQQGRSLWSMVASPVLKWGGVQLAAFAAVVLFTFARRSGPLLPLPVESRLSPLEFVETLGGLYHRVHAAQAAVEIAFTRFRQVLARRHGVRADVSAAEMARAVENSRLATVADFAVRLRRCEEAISDPGLTEQDALRHVQFLNEAGRALLQTKIQEKQNAGNS